MLSYFASFRAQCGYKGSLREISVHIAGDFQELTSMMPHTCCSKKKSVRHTWNKNQVQIRNTNPWCFKNLMQKVPFSASFCLWVYLIEDEYRVSNTMPIYLIWKKHPKKCRHLLHHREDCTKLRILRYAHVYLWGILDKLKPSTTKIHSYNSIPIKVRGTALCNITFKNQAVPVKSDTLPGSCQPILNGKKATQLQIILIHKNILQHSTRSKWLMQTA